MSEWTVETIGDTTVWRPGGLPSEFLVAFSGRAAAPPGEREPTEFLTRRLANALGQGALPVVRATQVHGARVVTIESSPAPGAVSDAGDCDALATRLENVGLAIQTADCAPLILAAEQGVAVAHAGWRGSAKNVAGAAAAALAGMGADLGSVCVWIGPTIGVCCYEVGGEVAARFDGSFSRSNADGRFRLDLLAINRAQLVAAGVLPERIRVHPACTLCGGERFASYRRDGARAGRMIALVARLAPRGGVVSR